jgi:CRP-like cAMP-binding protein
MDSGNGLSRPFAERVEPEDWAELIASGVPVHFPARQVLFHQGETGRHVYVLRDGVVKVVRAEADGGQTMLSVRSMGDVIGDMAALDNGGEGQAWALEMSIISVRGTTLTRLRPCGAPSAISWVSSCCQPAHVVNRMPR